MSLKNFLAIVFISSAFLGHTQTLKKVYPKGIYKTFKDFVNLSQETQAKGMQMAIRTHINNQPHCMGSLFWQLNDCWPGPSWSIIDYYGKKKKAYEVVKEEFEE